VLDQSLTPSSKTGPPPSAPEPNPGLSDDVLWHTRSSLWFSALLFGGAVGIELRENSIHTSSESGEWVALHSEIGKIERESGLLWDRVRITRRGSEEAHEVRGLRKGDATTLLEALEVRKHLGRLHRANAEFNALVERDRYFNRQALRRWLDSVGDLAAAYGKWTSRLSSLPVPEHARAQIRVFLDRVARPDVIVAARNDVYVRTLLSRYKQFFDCAEQNPLTERQREAIAHDEDNCLVVAGAGTGKTSTVVAKVGFLLEHDRIAPERILLLAFARKAKEEMEERVEKRCKVKVPVHTFHSLGLQIVASVNGKAPSVSAMATDAGSKRRFLSRCVDEMLAAPAHREAVIEFLAFHRYPERQEWECPTREEYLRHLKAQQPTTLIGERVRSWGELRIANWLALHGVKYAYEQAYEHNTATQYKRQYKPDFFLPENGIYLEHWGVDQAGGTAPGVDRQKYHEGMEWKRALHRQYGTSLLETYSFQHREGYLEGYLEEQLRKAGVRVRRIGEEERRALVAAEKNVSPVVDLLGTFLSLFNSNQWTMPEVTTAADARPDRARLRSFLTVFEQVLARYEAELRRVGELDFDDMIARATEHVEMGQYGSPFTHIVVDEFQDVSRGRCRFLQALLGQHQDRRLMCVGDDWQSIYRFAGSDIAIMTSFAEVFGHTRRTDLDRTFRFNDKILDFSTRFVTRNPAQLKKDLISPTKSPGAAVSIITEQHGARDDGGLLQALDDIRRREQGRREKTSVLLLGRYRHTAPRALASVQRRYPELAIDYKTAHASKGLEADYAVVLGLTSGSFGFPSEIVDDPALDLVLAAPGGYPNAEERRLFYVAATRGRRHLYLVTDATRASVFATEVQGKGYHGLALRNAGGTAPVSCPECREGTLVKLYGKHGAFWRCSLGPYCEGKAQPCGKCGVGPRVKVGGRWTCSDTRCRGN
jgi:DNA helicase IV